MEFGDRLFWGIMIFIGINLLWLGLLENYVSMWVGAVVGLIGLFAAIKYIPKPKTEDTKAGE